MEADLTQGVGGADEFWPPNINRMLSRQRCAITRIAILTVVPATEHAQYLERICCTGTQQLDLYWGYPSVRVLDADVLQLRALGAGYEDDSSRSLGRSKIRCLTP